MLRGRMIIQLANYYTTALGAFVSTRVTTGIAEHATSVQQMSLHGESIGS